VPARVVACSAGSRAPRVRPHVRRHLVAAGSGARAEGGPDRRGTGAQPDHPAHGRLEDAVQQAASTGVRGGDHTGVGVRQQDGDAVGDQHPERHGGPRRHQRVTTVGREQVPRPARFRQVVDDLHPRAVDLPGEADRRTGPLPEQGTVAADVRGVVPDVEGRGRGRPTGPPGDTARPGGEPCRTPRRRGRRAAPSGRAGHLRGPTSGSPGRPGRPRSRRARRGTRRAGLYRRHLDEARGRRLVHDGAVPPVRHRRRGGAGGWGGGRLRRAYCWGAGLRCCCEHLDRLVPGPTAPTRDGGRARAVPACGLRRVDGVGGRRSYPGAGRRRGPSPAAGGRWPPARLGGRDGAAAERRARRRRWACCARTPVRARGRRGGGWGSRRRNRPRSRSPAPRRRGRRR
jgi:hypothetical protein